MKQALYRKDDNEFLGYITKDAVSWEAQTIFGYTIAKTETEEEATKLLQEKGMSFLTGVWQYYDKDDSDWFPCVIKEASENQVIVIRTNYMGYQDPDDFKFVTIKHPSENTLIKSS